MKTKKLAQGPGGLVVLYKNLREKRFRTRTPSLSRCAPQRGGRKPGDAAMRRRNGKPLRGNPWVREKSVRERGRDETVTRKGYGIETATVTLYFGPALLDAVRRKLYFGPVLLGAVRRKNLK